MHVGSCPPGTYHGQTTQDGTQLLANDSQSSIVVPQCTECPVGYYQPDQGQTSCEICPPGSTSTTTGSTSCSPNTTSRPSSDSVSDTTNIKYVAMYISYCKHIVNNEL